MKAKHIAFLFLLLVVAVVVWKFTQPETPADGPSAGESEKLRGKDTTTASDSTAASGERAKQGRVTSNESPTADAKTTPTKRRKTVVSSDGIRRIVTDPMASWKELPAWPEGPRLFAEVDTASRRYINLRPDDAGELPRVMAGANERLGLSINFPEGEPGEKIYVELPNGGAFPDTNVRGRVFELPENRTLSFPYITDEANGYCNVKLRHRGHTRSIPVWVGDLPKTDS